tara:strand:- start:560 stop:718 length:159 start_codon:yes stop_codon:yes gene_type:complete
MVLLVLLEMLGETFDALTEKSYLHLRAARIAFAAGKSFDNGRTGHFGYFHSS